MGSGRSGSGSCSGKGRLKWTQELHVRFEKAINLLGGADRATPRSILKSMQVPELTIYHVKSHLQKYRIQKLIPESGPGAGEGRYVKRNLSEMLLLLRNFSSTSGAQFNEALRLQQLHTGMSDHTEVQRSLKLKFEAQRRFMERMTDNTCRQRQRSTSISITNNNNMLVMPGLSEVESAAKGAETPESDDSDDAEKSISYCNISITEPEEDYGIQDLLNLKKKKKKKSWVQQLQVEEESSSDDPIVILPPPAFSAYDCELAASRYLLGPGAYANHSNRNSTSSMIFQNNQQQQQRLIMGISPSSSLYPAAAAAYHDVNSLAWNAPVSCPGLAK